LQTQHAASLANNVISNAGFCPQMKFLRLREGLNINTAVATPYFELFVASLIGVPNTHKKFEAFPNKVASKSQNN